MTYFSNIKTAVSTVFEGMTITFSHLLREPMTIQYPDRTPLPVKDTLPPRYRGFLCVRPEICTACTLCQKTCPIDCIVIEHSKDEELKQRVMTRFDIDMAKCMFCGLCTEQCSTGAIYFTNEFEASTSNIKDLVFKFIKQGEKVIPYKIPRKKKPAAAAAETQAAAKEKKE
ncbi:MAG: NADH-quinone oxidoreductase subunit I [Deltaproteobacteria bacterium]|nr:NADH-quinone oxidoreductase subunit I [Deltaproteobacteria bacterium]